MLIIAILKLSKEKNQLLQVMLQSYRADQKDCKYSPSVPRV